MLVPIELFAAELPLSLPVEGSPFSAELKSIDDKGQITFQTAGQKQQMSLDNLVLWGACGDPKQAPILLPTDGGLIVADAVSTDQDSLVAESIMFGQLRLPLSALAGVVYRLPGSPKDRDALLDRIEQAQGEADRLLLDNGDELTGLLEKIAEDVIKLKSDLGTIFVEIPHVQAIIFNPSLIKKPPLKQNRCWLGTSDGSRLLAGNIHIDSSVLKFDTLGLNWTSESKNLVFLQPLSERIKYLSSLQPTEYRFVPFLDVNWPYNLDRNATGSWLRASGKLYLKGIGVHSGARLTYDLDQPYRQFQAELAIDDATDGKGSVRFHVLVDGREKFSSEIIRANMPPVPIAVDIKGAKRLELIVDYADHADVLDHADWLNARMIE